MKVITHILLALWHVLKCDFLPLQGAKEDPAQSKVPKFLAKAGWVKKAPAKLLASYKDRFIHVEKTELVVYENEVSS